MKQPTNASIRRALTTLKKAGIINLTEHPIDLNTAFVITIATIPVELLSPKKTRKVRLKTKKVKQNVAYSNCSSAANGDL